MSTYSVKPEDIERKWYVVDAADQPIGRLAAAVAQILRGKHKPMFAYNADVGDHVIVINAAKAKLTGNKGDELVYHHTGYPGGIKSISRGKLMKTKPERLIERAVWGMLPKHNLGRKIYAKLKVYAGSEHPHEAQGPEVLELSRSADAKPETAKRKVKND